jgi:hypothetical protein
LVQIKVYETGISRFIYRHASLKSKDWLTLNHDKNHRAGAICLPADWCVSDQEPKKRKPHSACWSSTKKTLSSSHQNVTCSRHDIAVKLFSWRYKKSQFGMLWADKADHPTLATTW